MSCRLAGLFLTVALVLCLPQILVQVDMPHFDIGDAVRVLDDLAELHRLQSNIGDWNDDMALVGA